MKRKIYEAPVTTCTEVELECGFMSSGPSENDPIGGNESSDISIKEQSAGVAIGSGGAGFDGGWGNDWDK